MTPCSRLQSTRVKIVFFGTPEFAIPSLEQLLARSHEIVLVVAQPDRPAGRGMRVQSPPTVELARERNLPVSQPLSVRKEEFLDSMRALRPELAVVIAYGKLLPVSLLGIPKHGFLNVHASLLPRYRGAAPIQRAIEAGERETGVTIMRVDEELDHGPILGMGRIQIGPDEHAASLSARLAEAGAELLANVIDRLARGEVVEAEQDHSRATYAAKIRKEEGRVDWNVSSRTIYDRFRAFDPWPGTFFDSDFERAGESVKLASIALEPRAGPPGEILASTDTSIIVACGEGSLRIDRLQRAGKRPVDAATYLRSRNLSVGDSLR